MNQSLQVRARRVLGTGTGKQGFRKESEAGELGWGETLHPLFSLTSN